LSYDFFKNAGRSNLARFPLGPKGADGKALLPELDEFAFEHAGGEIIYNLPNGLNGYMLVTEKGARIDSGPISIVWDSTQTSGNPEIVNGISCMNCHKHGTIKFEDNIRDGVAIFNAPAQKKVQELYVTKDEMNRLLDQAGSDYLRKLDQAIGGFLKQGEDVTKDITSFAEPVSFVARRYDSNVSLEAAARELGFSEPEQLRNRLGGKRLIQLGLGPLVNSGGTVKRSFWDSRESGISVFQEAASELARGTPVP
jgi:serine/threonine-protein kinase